MSTQPQLVPGYRHLTVELLEAFSGWTADAYPQNITYVDPQTGVAGFMGAVQTSRGHLYLYDVRLDKERFPAEEPFIYVSVLNDDADPWQPSTWRPVPLPPTPHRYAREGSPICVHGGYSAEEYTPAVSITACRTYLEEVEEWHEGLFPEFNGTSREIPQRIRDRVA